MTEAREKPAPKWSRQFAMPSEDTFSIRPISDLLDRWLPTGMIIDPFARNSTRGTLTNDLNPRTRAQYHFEAEYFLASLPGHQDAKANAVLFDPPYSPRQIAECYRIAKKRIVMADTQNARLCKSVKDGLDRHLRVGGIAICCGWNSGGFGKERGYKMLEILLVNHGAAHNDTIVTVERKGEKE